MAKGLKTSEISHIWSALSSCWIVTIPQPTAVGCYRTKKSKSEVEKDFSDAIGYGDLKKRVAEVVIDELTPIRERYHELMTNPDELDKILALGSEKASEIAEPKINEMKYNIGFIT